jgi:kinesin family member C2/C3
VKVINEKGREKTWEFDEVFNLETTQAQVYAEVSDLVTSVLDGYNVCIFAYGQTGSGSVLPRPRPSLPHPPTGKPSP